MELLEDVKFCFYRIFFISTDLDDPCNKLVNWFRCSKKSYHLGLLPPHLVLSFRWPEIYLSSDSYGPGKPAEKLPPIPPLLLLLSFCLVDPHQKSLQNLYALTLSRPAPNSYHSMQFRFANLSGWSFGVFFSSRSNSIFSWGSFCTGFRLSENQSKFDPKLLPVSCIVESQSLAYDRDGNL